MSNFVRMFQPQFADQVATGKKRRTIRKIPKRLPVVGDTVSLRKWEGRPYRSKQVELLSAKLIAVQSVDITDNWNVFINGIRLGYDDRHQLALDDGFDSFVKMFRWIEKTYGMNFCGIILKW